LERATAVLESCSIVQRLRGDRGDRSEHGCIDDVRHCDCRRNTDATSNVSAGSVALGRPGAPRGPQRYLNSLPRLTHQRRRLGRHERPMRCLSSVRPNIRAPGLAPNPSQRAKGSRRAHRRASSSIHAVEYLRRVGCPRLVMTRRGDHDHSSTGWRLLVGCDRVDAPLTVH